MVNREKLTEATMLALQNKLTENVDETNLAKVKDILSQSGIKNERTLDLMSKDVLKDLNNYYDNDCKDGEGVFYDVCITDAIQKKIQQITGKKPDLKIGK